MGDSFLMRRRERARDLCADRRVAHRERVRSAAYQRLPPRSIAMNGVSPSAPTYGS